jgi:uncharacterized protein (TIGR02271 family)
MYSADFQRVPAGMILRMRLRMASENEISGMEDNRLKDEGGVVIPVIEEQLTVGKRVVETGKVLVSKTVEEVSESVNMELLHDEHVVEHVPVNELVDVMPAVRYEGQTIIIPVLKEVLVKRVLLVEEIRITKRVVQTTEQQEVTLRRERVTVDQNRTDQ